MSKAKRVFALERDQATILAEAQRLRVTNSIRVLYYKTLGAQRLVELRGDRVRIVLHNKLPESTTIHWHGLEVPLHMDGAQPTTGRAGWDLHLRIQPQPKRHLLLSLARRDAGDDGNDRIFAMTFNYNLQKQGAGGSV